MIYLHKNGITVVAKEEAKRGKVYELNGEEYYIARGVADIKRIVESGEYPLNRVVTSKLTSLNYLFQIQGATPKLPFPRALMMTLPIGTPVMFYLWKRYSVDGLHLIKISAIGIQAR